LLFVADEPQAVGALARATSSGEQAVRKALSTLADDLEARGLRLQDDNGRYQLVTAAQYSVYIEAFLGQGPVQRLSRASLETLTIIAYRQPCTRAEIEAIRGANSDHAVLTLERRSLIENIGTADAPGRPKLYRTTTRFMEHFGIASRDELPPLPEPAEPEPAGEPRM
ncbi:MAG: SMC-Scp complex subunit ScpB, partial [Dehalococcoidia bacterium]